MGFPALQADCTADMAIVGAGITGLTAATLKNLFRPAGPTLSSAIKRNPDSVCSADKA
jgi:predicted NAD/FAD-binding protein